jgi:hypothetical protein
MELPGVSLNQRIALNVVQVDALRMRYEAVGDLDTLRRLTAVGGELAELSDVPAHRAAYADALVSLHACTGEPEPLERAVPVIAAVVAGARAGVARDLPELLARQAACYLARHVLTGAADDLESAIEALTESLATTPLGQPDPADP